MDAVWLEWSEWTFCNKACGNGTGMRTRQCKHGMYGGRRDCIGNSQEEFQCNTHTCPRKRFVYLYEIKFGGSFSPKVTICEFPVVSAFHIR